MTSRATVTCDGCGRPIDTTTSYMSEAYLALANIWKSHAGVASFGMDSWDQGVDGTKHFHNVECLTAYCVRGVKTSDDVQRVLAVLSPADG